MKDRVFAFMEQQHMINQGDRVVAGVSGGADSVCLLLLLWEYQKKIPFGLAAVHVNHGIREEAKLDADYVKALCGKLEVPFFLYEKDVPRLAGKEKLSLEEAGRKARYEAFREVLNLWKDSQWEEEKKEVRAYCGPGKIAVAHHMQDSAETLLFNLFRGTGIWGLSGIRPVREEIIRPLLKISRREIEDWLEERGTGWCIDSTNGEDTYTRNKIRNHILPYAEKEIVLGSTRHIARTALDMAELTDYIKEERGKAAKECCTIKGKEKKGAVTVSIDLERWQRYPLFLQKQILLWALEEAGRGRKDVGRVHLEALLGLTQKEGYRKTDLPGGLEGIKEYTVLRIQVKEEKKEQILYQTLTVPGSFSFGEDWRLELDLVEKEKVGRIEENQYTKYFDYDKINNCLTLRNRKQGDYLTINGAGQRKSLKEYMIQEKIAAPLRDRFPVIAEGNHILWVPGHRISAYYKVTGHTNRCVRMTIWREKWQKKYV